MSSSAGLVATAFDRPVGFSLVGDWLSTVALSLGGFGVARWQPRTQNTATKTDAIDFKLRKEGTDGELVLKGF